MNKPDTDQPVGAEQVGKLRLYDRADGVRNHFCIGRKRADGAHEFWNHGKFYSAGQVFVGRELAEAKLAELTEPSPTNLAPDDDPDHGFTPEQIAEFEKAEDRVDAWLQTEGLKIAKDAAAKARAEAGEPLTVEACLKELREMFPDKWRITITTTQWINRPDEDYEPEPERIYSDHRILLPDVEGNPNGCCYFRARTLQEAMTQVRAWKEQQ